MTMHITTFFVKRSYASLAAGSFTIASKQVQELVESEVFIVYANTGLGNAFAVRNITLTPVDEANVRVEFDPLTDVHAMPPSVLPKESLTESTQQYLMFPDDVAAAPRFCVSNHASGNEPNMLCLNHDVRERLIQYKGGMISLTELVLVLHDQGISVTDIHQHRRNKEKYVAQITERTSHVIELSKDNGVKQHDSDFPLLARLNVYL